MRILNSNNITLSINVKSYKGDYSMASEYYSFAITILKLEPEKAKRWNQDMVDLCGCESEKWPILVVDEPREDNYINISPSTQPGNSALLSRSHVTNEAKATEGPAWGYLETRPSALGMSDPIWGPLIHIFVDEEKKCEG